MLGTILNAAAIVAGGVIGLTTTRNLSGVHQSRAKVWLGVFTVYAGLSTALDGFSGSFGHRLAQLGLAILALMAGKLTGQVLHLQKGLNRLGQLAQRKIAAASKPGSNRFAEGFITCTLLFCVAPIAILGAVQDGLMGSIKTLAVKSALDGLATMAFAKMFGWGVILSAVPVLAYQGTLTLLAALAEPYFRDPPLMRALSLTSGLLVFSIALVILDLKKVPLADYLPSLIYAPLFAGWWLR